MRFITKWFVRFSKEEKDLIKKWANAPGRELFVQVTGFVSLFVEEECELEFENEDDCEEFFIRLNKAGFIDEPYRGEPQDRYKLNKSGIKRIRRWI